MFHSDKAIERVANKVIFVVYPYDKSERIASSYEPILNVLDFNREYYIIQYTILNVGAGNALNLSFKTNDKPVIPPFAQAVSDTKVFVILLKVELLKGKKRSLCFKYEYQDVASIEQYEQHETIVLIEEDNGSLNSTQQMNDIISQPEEIRKTQND